MLDLVQLTDLAKIERYLARVSEWISKLTAPILQRYLEVPREPAAVFKHSIVDLLGVFRISAAHRSLIAQSLAPGIYWMLLER